MKVNSDQVPTKHPRLFKAKFFEGEAALSNEEYPLTTETPEIRCQEEVSFDDIFGQSDEDIDWKYVALIGYPGSGKTTLAKRLAKSEKITLCFLFTNFNFGERELTLKELLFNRLYPDLTYKPSLTSRIFQWVIDNQKEVAIIIDGFDQSEWNLNNDPPLVDYETPQRIEDLISNICYKKYLPNVHLVITSRPHIILRMPYQLRPKLTLFVKDLSFDDMRSLFFTFAQERAQEMWDRITNEAPHLLKLCLNPMMLQCCVEEFLRSLASIEQMAPSKTWTEILDTVIGNIRRLENITNRHINSISKQLAFDATMESTVTITYEQLRRESLTMEDVQDLIIAVQGLDRYTNFIQDEDISLYFFLHLLQEYFTANYMIKDLSGSQFANALGSQFFTSERSMMKKLVYGLLFDMPSRGKCMIVPGQCPPFNSIFRKGKTFPLSNEPNSSL